ncbi:hypothetical protein JD844_011206 [Phrynosoma platyrhinos]|uniref:GTPase RhebL1 n=1 Tax=Phrynosoma platyrhinos TaxID=52577 RepID=A0ABQ7TIM2_PHRPL|nr:hypothetical protein JD844_011206 [Phrynosoma platyrhinos]
MRSAEAGASVVVTWAFVVAAPAALYSGGLFVPPFLLPSRRHFSLSLLLGQGKTSLAHQFIDGEFLDCYDPTVESTYNKMLMVGKDEFHLQLVDTAGQDEYTILPHSFTIGIHGYVLVYSVTSLKSFQVVKSLHSKLYESRGKTRMPVVLVGNKADLSIERLGIMGPVRQGILKGMEQHRQAPFPSPAEHALLPQPPKAGPPHPSPWFGPVPAPAPQAAVVAAASAVPADVVVGPPVPCQSPARLQLRKLTQGIFTKVIEEIDRVDNSCGEHRSCVLM